MRSKEEGICKEEEGKREGESELMRVCTYASMRGDEGTCTNRRRGRAGRNLWKQEDGICINTNVCI